jgi:hypothetical protein
MKDVMQLIDGLKLIWETDDNDLANENNLTNAPALVIFPYTTKTSR